MQHHSLDFAVVVLREAVLFLHFVALLLQDAPAGALRLRLQRVKHRGAHQQVGEHAEDQRQGPDVLLLHPRCRHESGQRRHSYRWWCCSSACTLHIGVAACCVKRRKKQETRRKKQKTLFGPEFKLNVHVKTRISCRVHWERSISTRSSVKASGLIVSSHAQTSRQWKAVWNIIYV